MDAGGAIERAQSGDSDAFRLLVEQHSRVIFRLAFRMTGNEEDAEDVVQETFLRAYRRLSDYEALFPNLPGSSTTSNEVGESAVLTTSTRFE